MSTTPLPDYRMHTQALTLREMAKNVSLGALTLDPPYQRGDVWTEEQRVNLMRSLLMGIPVAALIINRRGANLLWQENHGDPGECWYACVDGKQRITTGVLWFTGQLLIPSSWLRPEFLPESGAGPLVSYPDLSLPGQRWMGQNFTLPVAEAQLPSLEVEAEVYGLVNGAGTPQTEEDLARARALAGN